MMKKFAILLVVHFFLVSAQLDFGSNNQESFDEYMKNLSRKLEAKRKRIEENAIRAQNEAQKKIEKLQKELDDIRHSAEQIEAGNQPTGIQSNTTSLSTVNIRGSVYTIKSTIFSTGNDQKGAVHNVETVYKGSAKKTWSVDTISWNAKEINRKYSRQSIGSGSLTSSDGSISLD